MSSTVGAVIFADTTKLYLIFDENMNTALRPLFSTEQAAREWLQSGAKPIPKPSGATTSEEPVTLIMDLELEGMGDAVSFTSRASKQAMWLTGPRSFLEMAYINGATASREF